MEVGKRHRRERRGGQEMAPGERQSRERCGGAVTWGVETGWQRGDVEGEMWSGEMGLEGEMGGMAQGPRTSGPTGKWRSRSVVLLIYRKGNKAVLFV